MSSYQRSITGRRSRADGEMFERWIESACKFYRLLGIAHIEKTPEPMRPLRPYGDRRTGQFIAVFTKQAQPDFKGVLCDGTGIMFDAKHTNADRISQSVVTEEQTTDLDLFQKMGAHCYILVGLGMQDFYRVPWQVWKAMKEKFGHKYMSREDLEPYRVKEHGLIILFLEGIELEDR